MRSPLVIAAFALVLAWPGTRLAAQRRDDAAAAWARAERAWAKRSPDAYDLWLAIPEESAEGRRARARLERAGALYAEGIAALPTDGGAARSLLVRAQAFAPMDPDLYLPLARACVEAGLFEQAGRYYDRFLDQAERGPERAAALRERDALSPVLRDFFAPVSDGGVPEAAPEDDGSAALADETEAGATVSADRDRASLVLFGLTLGLLTSAGAVALRRRSPTLVELAEKHPELHPAIAFLVSSLRHELLKHRIGAAGDAVLALGEGRASRAELDFVWERLYGGQPIRDAFRAHRAAFERALGHGLDLRRDPSFRRAELAIRRIERLEPKVRARRPDAFAALAAEHAILREFDAHIGSFAARLVRTRVDRGLLERVAAGIRGEYHAGAVELDELRIEADEPADVEVFHADLELVLRNVLRNAILAVREEPPPRRVAMLADVRLEPTGEETVRIRVLDSATKRLDRSLLADRQIDRGLGLVTATVNRYGGTIDVERTSELGYSKEVVVSFFRVWAERDDEEAER